MKPNCQPVILSSTEKLPYDQLGNFCAAKIFAAKMLAAKMLAAKMYTT